MSKAKCFHFISICFICCCSVFAAELHVPADYSTIQAAIDAAEAGDEVILADGTYAGDGNRDVSFLGKGITVRSQNGPENCRLNGSGSADEVRAFMFENGETSEAVLQGISIENFQVRAITVIDSSPRILDCHFISNEGGIYVNGPAHRASIEDCLFIDNYPRSSGGGIRTWETEIDIIGCIFIGNQGEYDGGALATWKTTGVVADCIFDSNLNDAYAAFIDAYGGAVGAWSSQIDFINCLFVDNVVTGDPIHAYNGFGGAGVFDNNGHSEPNRLLNCTIYGNQALEDAVVGGIYGIQDLTIRNCIFGNNSGGDFGGTVQNIEYCTSEDHLPGVGNFQDSPQFTDPGNGLFYLNSTSPCVDAGNAPASEICFQRNGQLVCLDELYSVVGSDPDTGTVDIGFHYGEPYTPDPTPTPTFTPSYTHTPTPTHTPIPDEGVTLSMPSDHFSPEDPCSLTASIYLPTSAGDQLPFFLILDAYDMLFFYPTWSTEPAWELVDIQTDSVNLDILPQFSWPANTGSGNATFYAAVTDPGMNDIWGNPDILSFTWE